MPIKNLALGLGLLASGTAFAQEHQYRVKHNSPLRAVAEKCHVDLQTLAKLNHLPPDAKVSAGALIKLPTAPIPNGYVVRNGENGYTIAHKFHMYLPQLQAANKGIDWSSLQPGAVLQIPGAAKQLTAKKPAATAVAAKSTPGAKKSTKSAVAKANKVHTVVKGENNWIIAKNVGVRITELKVANPGVDLENLHPGQKINLPSRAFVASASTPKVKRIRSRYALVIGDNVSIRRKPSTNAERVTTVDSGLHVAVLDREGAWYKLKFPKGTVGWVRGDFLAPTNNSGKTRVARRSRSSSEGGSHHYARRSRRRGNSGSLHGVAGSGSEVVEIANNYIGTPYSYGSMSRGATDCSGLVHQVYAKKGVKLPRTSREMSQVGSSVGKGDLKPGDMVFFRTRNSRRINHVGIYAGNGKFIHASSGGGKVQVNSLSDGYYANRFAGAKRVVKGGSKKKAPEKKTDSEATEQ